MALLMCWPLFGDHRLSTLTIDLYLDCSVYCILSLVKPISSIKYDCDCGSSSSSHSRICRCGRLFVVVVVVVLVSCVIGVIVYDWYLLTMTGG